MKYSILTVLIVFSTPVFSQIKAYTQNDDEVWLYEDGTWEYAQGLKVNVELITMSSPPFSATYSTKKPAKAPKISQLTSTVNKISDDNQWLVKNDLSLNVYEVPNKFSSTEGNVPDNTPLYMNGEMLVGGIYDDTYNYFIYGENFSEGRYLLITDKEVENTFFIFDFETYRLSPDYESKDKAYVNQRISWVQIEGEIMYVSHSHMTYASSSRGMNAYITAINLKDNSILWRSQPLVSNAKNFVIHKDFIVCGYGFTKEKDYLYTLDKYTGKVNAKKLIKSGPSYIVLKDNIFYVRTYNTDYTFKIE